MVLSSGDARDMGQRFKVAPFEFSHADGVLINQYEKLSTNLDAAQEAWSAFYDGELVAISGGIVLDGKISGWVLFTDKITPRGFFAYHRALKRVIEEYISHGKTVFLHVDPSFKQAQKWAELMGFKFVGEDEVQGQLLQRFER